MLLLGLMACKFYVQRMPGVSFYLRGANLGELRKRHPISQAIRDMRRRLGISQQELAFRTGMAIRTIARWELEQPPHGRALYKLWQLAQDNALKEIGDHFLTALKDDVVFGHVAAVPELKLWIEGVNEIFRFRDRDWLLWDRLAWAVIDGVHEIAARSMGIGKPDARLMELMENLKKSAVLPAESEMNRLAEELASREGLPYDAAYTTTKETHPLVWEQYVQEEAQRAKAREFRQTAFVIPWMGPDKR
jgi:transcriptional regulator with XRE-family HTH domain